MQILSGILDVPFVWSNHLDDIPSGFIYRKMTFYGKKVICVSSDLKLFCVNKLCIPADDIEVVIHGIDPTKYHFDTQYVEAFKAKHAIGEQKIIGLFARMAPMKGHACLVEALAKLPDQKRKKTKTVFFGGTEGEYANHLKEMIYQKGLQEDIIFEGFVTPSEALSLSDITVLPSLKEGFGIVSLESFLMKKPHIRTHTAGYEDIKDGCVGFAVGDSDALCRELEAFIDGKDYSDLIEYAYRIVTETCTLEAMTDRIIAIYENIIS